MKGLIFKFFTRIPNSKIIAHPANNSSTEMEKRISLKGFNESDYAVDFTWKGGILGENTKVLPCILMRINMHSAVSMAAGI
jgi:hypothetical protein